MNRWQWLLGLLAFAFFLQAAPAQGVIGMVNQHKLRKVNMKLCGQVIDFTHNHGSDNRIWSPALCERRDVYVYLPPGYSPDRKYPMGIFLHGSNQDEHFFLRQPVQLFDQAIANGELPPVIIVAPDGSLQGRPSFLHTASFFANSRAGNYEDYLMTDVWNFVMENFPIYPEREAHSLVGVSAGGSAAFALAMKHKDRVKTAVGFAPALNLRWVDANGRYDTKFDPDNWGWRTSYKPLEVIGRPAMGLVKIRFCTLLSPLVGKGGDVEAELSRVNPIEIMERTNLQDKELNLYIAYGGKDEFNIDSHVDSFLYMAKQRGVSVTVDFDPNGKHNVATGARQFPAAIRWVAPIMARYAVQRNDPDAAPVGTDGKTAARP